MKNKLVKCKNCNKWYSRKKWALDYCYNCTKKQVKMKIMNRAIANTLAKELIKQSKEVK